MHTLLDNANYKFMAHQRPAWVLSAALVGLSLLLLVFKGLNFGVDFTGGYTIEAGFSQAPDLNEVRAVLAASDFPQAQVQSFGSSTEILVRMAPREGLVNAELSSDMLMALRQVDAGEVTMRRVEFVGPQVGEELREKGGLAVLMALGAIVIYIWLRFEKKFSIGAVAATVHDVIITLGVFSLFGIEFDLTILASILAVIGYSLNDTIVVFDRIRENFLTMRRGEPAEVIDASINQTLSRTIITSGTTLMVVLALYFFGGQIIHGFALALLVGIGVGTYSSIFIASAITHRLGITREDMLPVEKEGAELDEIP